jgi:hypothetical protein
MAAPIIEYFTEENAVMKLFYHLLIECYRPMKNG